MLFDILLSHAIYICINNNENDEYEKKNSYLSYTSINNG